MGTDTLITALKVNQTFSVGGTDVHVLKDVNFSLISNTFNIIYGASGSGKSTLLNILTGLQKPTEGTILFGGQDVYEFNPNELAHFRANQVGIVYQQNYWVKSLNVAENVSLPMYFLGYTRRSAHKLALAALDQVGMASYAKSYPSMLSGGEQQRIAMARALVTEPLFIIADEPTGSLDSKNGDMIMELLQHCQKDLKRTIILVTHNMEYLPLSDNLLHIADGRVQEMPHDNIRATTDALMKDMKERIDRLSLAKQQGVKPQDIMPGRPTPPSAPKPPTTPNTPPVTPTAPGTPPAPRKVML